MAIAYSMGATFTDHMLTARSLPPQVKMYFPSEVQQMSVTSSGCAIKPIVLLGLPSMGNLIKPITFLLVL